MSSVWDFVLNEYNALQAAPRPPAAKIFWADLVESKIDRVCHLSGRPLIIYASACTVQVGKVAPELLAIDQSDKMGFHSMLEDVNGAELDVLIHSPGGSAEAAETIVEEIRRKFPGHVRFIVPSYAKSAATMMVMSGNIILMDEDAELGPIDPQFFTRNGVVPGEAIKQQFEKAAKDILSDPKRAQVWYPIMQMLGPGLLAQCDNASQLSINLVTDWLTKYMFNGQVDGPAKAKKIADYLSDHSTFKSHSRRIKIEQLEQNDVEVKNLRDDANFYRAVWELYCALDIMLSNTPLYKIFYNSAHVAMIRQNAAQQQMPFLPFQIPRLPIPPQPKPAAPKVLKGFAGLISKIKLKIGVLFRQRALH